MSGLHVRPPAEVTLDFDANEASCPVHGVQPIREDHIRLCPHVREVLSLSAQGIEGVRLCPAGPVVEVRS